MEQRYKKKLTNLKEINQFRQFKDKVDATYINTTSNDYLGYAQNDEIIQEFYRGDPQIKFGATGSRLLSGNHEYYQKFESTLKSHYGKEALLLASGYDANELLIETLFTSDDVIFLDNLNHASIMKASYNTKAKIVLYNHLDNEDLEEKLNKYRSRYENAIIITESVFSMDGDIADLVEIVRLKKEHNSYLMVDEAHSFGIFGNGLGLCNELKLICDVDFIMLGFGKALSSTGGVLILDELYKNYIINFGKKLIFSTAIPPINVAYNLFVFNYMVNDDKSRLKLKNNMEILNIETPILPIVCGTNQKAEQFASYLKENKILAYPIKYPTVRKNTSRVRIVINAQMEHEDVIIIKKAIEKYDFII